MIQIKRVYEAPKTEDGARILIDRLWPRGISKEKAKITFWLKEITPSPSLRIWFSHDPEKFGEFKKRYRSELKGNRTALLRLREFEKKYKRVTLVYGAKSPVCNHAVILKEYYLNELAKHKL